MNNNLNFFLSVKFRFQFFFLLNSESFFSLNILFIFFYVFFSSRKLISFCVKDFQKEIEIFISNCKAIGEKAFVQFLRVGKNHLIIKLYYQIAEYKSTLAHIKCFKSFLNFVIQMTASMKRLLR